MFSRKNTLFFKDPFDLMFGLDRQMNSMFGNPALYRGVEHGIAKLRSLQDGYEIVCDLPGVKPDELKIALEEHTLSIEATPKSTLPEGYEARHQERASLSVSHRIDLPRDVDREGIEAKLKDGVLTLKLNKVAAAQALQIPVQVQA